MHVTQMCSKWVFVIL